MPVQFFAVQFDSGLLLHQGYNCFGDDLVRHADHDTVGNLLCQRADMPFHVAREYLVAQRLDHPLGPPGQMQARGILVAEIAGI